MKDATKDFFAEMFLCLLCGAAFGILGLLLGWGESRTGVEKEVEPTGCWIVAFGLGIWAWRWIRKPNSKRCGISRGFIRAVVTLLPVAALYTQATGMVDLTYDSGPVSSVPLWEAVVFTYGLCLLGFVAAAVVAGIIAMFRNSRKLLSSRTVA